MGRIALLCLLCLGVGVGVGMLLATDDERPTRTQRAERTDTGASGREAVERDPVGASDLSRALAALPAPSFERGTGTITGTVRTQDGKPLSGVTLRAIPSSGSPFARRREGDGPPQPVDLDALVRRTVKAHYRAKALQLDGSTDETGTFTLTGAGDSKYRVDAWVNGYTLDEQGNSWSVGAGGRIDFIAQRVLEIPVDVRLPDGTQPERASISLSAGNRSDGRHWLRRFGSLRLPPGSWKLTATVDDGAYTSTPVVVKVGDTPPDEPVLIQLRGNPGVHGDVRFADGPKIDLEVAAVRIGADGEEPPTSSLVASLHKVRVWHGDGFRIAGLTPGRYVVAAILDDDAVIAQRIVDVGEGPVRCDLVIESIDPALFVEVRVFGADGKPLDDLDFRTSFRSSGLSSSGGGTSIRRGPGLYWVIHHDSDGADGGTYGVEIRSESHGARTLSYKRGKRREFEVRFRETGTLVATMSGLAASEHAGRLSLRLNVPDADEDGPDPTSAKFDADGVARVGPVEVGEYELALMVRMGRHSTLTVSKQRIGISKGDTAHAMRLPTFHSTRITGLAKDANMRIRSADGSGGSRLEVGEDGALRIGPLPAGKYKVEQFGRDGGEMHFTLPGPAEIPFKAAQQNALLVTVTDAEGGLAKAGFLSGDIIIGIDGVEFSGRTQMQFAFMGAMGKPEVKMNVIRSGGTIELTVKPKQMMRGDRGGSLEPTAR